MGPFSSLAFLQPTTVDKEPKSGNVIPDSTFLFTFSCDEMNRCSFKDKGLADLIFQET